MQSTDGSNPEKAPHVVVPLSLVPPEVLPDAAGQTSPDQPKKHHRRSASKQSFASSTADHDSTATGYRSHFSALLAAEKAKAHKVGQHINHPTQVNTRYHTVLAWVGRIGWVGKAVVYSMIGGLACQSAVGNDRPDPTLTQQEQVSASPQVSTVHNKLCVDACTWAADLPGSRLLSPGHLCLSTHMRVRHVSGQHGASSAATMEETGKALPPLCRVHSATSSSSYPAIQVIGQWTEPLWWAAVCPVCVYKTAESAMPRACIMQAELCMPSSACMHACIWLQASMYAGTGFVTVNTWGARAGCIAA